MNNIIGKFEAIDSFMIFPDLTYGIIGELKERDVKPGHSINIELNTTLFLSAKIDEVKEIQLSRFDDKHTLLLVNVTNKDENEWLHAMNVGSEILLITLGGD